MDATEEFIAQGGNSNGIAGRGKLTRILLLMLVPMAWMMFGEMVDVVALRGGCLLVFGNSSVWLYGG